MRGRFGPGANLAGRSRPCARVFPTPLRGGNLSGLALRTGKSHRTRIGPETSGNSQTCPGKRGAKFPEKGKGTLNGAGHILLNKVPPQVWSPLPGDGGNLCLPGGA